LLQSTWAGYSLNEGTLQGIELRQFVAYLLAGAYAWDTDLPLPESLPYDFERLFIERYRREAVPLQAREGFVVDLSAAYNFDLATLSPLFAELPRGSVWLGGHKFILGERSAETPSLQVSPLSKGGTALAGLPVQARGIAPTWFPSRSGGNLKEGGDIVSPREMEGSGVRAFNALMLASYLAPEPLPREARISLERRAQSLYLLHTASWQTEQGKEVGRLIVEYADGTQAEQPIIYGLHLRAWNDRLYALEGLPLWRARDAERQSRHFALAALAQPAPREASPRRAIRCNRPDCGLDTAGTERRVGAPCIFYLPRAENAYGMRILVVDDEPMVRFLLVRFLEEEGHTRGRGSGRHRMRWNSLKPSAPTIC
jgi:CheY-like chemotaxis protein